MKIAYDVTSEVERTIQLKRERRISKLGLLIGLILLPFWGIGLLIWLVVIIDYYFQREITIVIEFDQKLKGVG